MQINKYIGAIVLFLGLASPALAACPTSVPVQDAVEFLQSNNGTMTKADKATSETLDAKQARPIEDTEMFLMEVNDTTTVALVKDNTIVCTSPPMPNDFFLKLIGKKDA